jgi:hypothetical protein
MPNGPMADDNTQGVRDPRTRASTDRELKLGIAITVFESFGDT